MIPRSSLGSSPTSPGAAIARDSSCAAGSRRWPPTSSPSTRTTWSRRARKASTRAMPGTARARTTIRPGCSMAMTGYHSHRTRQTRISTSPKSTSIRSTGTSRPRAEAPGSPTMSGLPASSASPSSSASSGTPPTPPRSTTSGSAHSTPRTAAARSSGSSCVAVVTRCATSSACSIRRTPPSRACCSERR